MKKVTKMLLAILPVVVIALVLFISLGSTVLASENSLMNFPEASGGGIEAVDNLAGNVWTTVLSVVQILAFCAILFSGIRYMFASADQKADIKKGLIYLVIGAVLVFASSTVVRIIVNTAEDVATGNVVENIQEIKKV